VDSGLQDILALPMVGLLLQQMGGTSLPNAPFDSLGSAASITVPVLVHHARADAITPFSQATSFIEALTKADKTLHAWPPPAGHNDIAVLHQDELTRLLRTFVTRVSMPALSAEELKVLSVKELKARAARKIWWLYCQTDSRARLRRTAARRH
jgi:hypothetical protein